MKPGDKGKIAVMAVSFVLFIIGAYAVYMDRGTVRTVLLSVMLAGLVCIAIRQTIRLRKKGK